MKTYKYIIFFLFWWITQSSFSQDTQQTAVDLGTKSASFTYTDTKNTTQYTDNYGRSSNDVYYKFTLSKSMDIVIDHCGSGVYDTFLYLLSSTGEQIISNDDYAGEGQCSNYYHSYIKMANLAAGTYYVVSEGFSADGDITTEIKGTSLSNDNGDATTGSDQNYIFTIIPTVAASSAIDLGTNQSLQTIQYFDGLGRPVETVQKEITPAKKDLVTLTEYDGAGRENKQWLPKTNNGSGAYVDPGVFINIPEPLYSGDSRAYSETVYEPSPLNRVTAQKGPGAVWSSHPVNTTYEANEPGIFYFSVNAYGNIQHSGNYASNMLYKTQVTDEDGKPAAEYKDKLGRVIMKRNGNIADTYYVYNDLGQLAYVVTPLGVDEMKWNKAYYDDNYQLQRYGYIYKYDDRGNCKYKRLPGCEPIYMVYDKADRLVLSQDGNQRKKSQWTVTKYDVFGRVVYTGTMQSSSSQSAFEATLKNVVVTETYNGSGSTGYTEQSYNVFTTITPLTVNYYDNYNFLPSGSALLYADKQGYSVRYYPPAGGWGTTGLLTGTRTYLLNESNTYTTSAFYYDDKGHIVQTRSTNQLGGYEYAYNQLDFTGKPTKTYTEHNITGKPAITELYTYTYDHAGRLKDNKHKLNINADSVMMNSNTYDELGRLTRKARHYYTDTETFTYNIRSQTTKITSGSFTENLYYNTGLPTGAVPCYNGNISYSTWTYGDATKGYAYKYDVLNRLTDADFKQGTSTQPDGAFDEKFGYDIMGNIKYLLRKKDNVPIDKLRCGHNGNQMTNVMDSVENLNQYAVKEYSDRESTVGSDYLYDENGNTITSRDQNIMTIQYNLLNLPTLIQFRNGDRIINTYDASGQKLRVDYYTIIHELATPLTAGDVYNQPYNPAVMIYEGTCFAGNKEYGIYKTPVTVNGTTTYQDVFTWKRIHTQEGYVDYYSTPMVNRYNYYRKDHLGSNREVWRGEYKNYHGTEVGSRIVQRMQYYPSGLPWAESVSPENNNRKYNGKEWIEMHGYDTYDYGARNMFPAVGGRFMTVDPLCEKYYSVSPYAYCLNNPVKFIDPTGKDVWVKRFEDGTYEVVGGNLNKDKGIYIATQDKKGNYIKTKEKIGESLTKYSFYGDNGKVVKGAIINPNDKSGENFLNNKIINDTPELSKYVPNARNGKDYDFKHQGAGDKKGDALTQHYYRGMPLNGVSSVVSNIDGKTVIYGTGRDVGNIGAGYVAGKNGLTWQEARAGFDVYQSWKSKYFQVEGPTTQSAELIGWENGWAAYQMSQK